MKRPVTTPDILVLLWLVLAGAGMALAAAAAMEPPSYDPYSYVVKAFGFWDGLANGRLVNPFGLGPSVRPPGTILVAYPFGFSLDFRWFYFRTCFIPLLMLVAAVYIAGYAPGQSTPQRWTLAALATVLGGMPALYQFQHNDLLQAASFWGLVDNFMAGVSALAIAAVMRSVRLKSWRWALTGALLAAFALMVKPAGFLVMAVVGLSWIILLGSEYRWSVARLKGDTASYVFAVKGLRSAAIVYILTVLVAVLSPYFSRGNIAFGSQVLNVMASTIVSSFNYDVLVIVVRMSFGFAIAAVIGAGIVASLGLRGARGEGAAALLSFVVGLWFWLIETDVVLARYFLPFAAIAFVTLVPVWMRLAGGRYGVTVPVGAAAAAVPTLVILALMLQPNPSLRWQGALGINLIANYYEAENRQGAALIAKMQNEADLSAPIYMFHTTSPLRNFAAGLMYPAFLDQGGPQANIRLPMDWRRSTTFRISEMLDSRYIAFEPVVDPDQRKRLLEKGAKDFTEEFMLMGAVFTDLDRDDGLCLISETRVRVVEVCDRALFESAMERVKQSYVWPPAFREANAM